METRYIISFFAQVCPLPRRFDVNVFARDLALEMVHTNEEINRAHDEKMRKMQDTGE